MKNVLTILFMATFLNACSKNKIETASTITSKHLDLLHTLNLLGKEEHLYKFYSEYKKDIAGNFYTDKRLACYWIDKNDTSKNKIEFAFYKNIIKLDTVYNAGATYCPYLLVTRQDSSIFKVCVDGKRDEITNFFDGAIDLWIHSKK